MTRRTALIMVIVTAAAFSLGARDCSPGEPTPQEKRRFEDEQLAEWCATPRPGDADWEDLCAE